MSCPNNEKLFRLVKTLSRGEKRHFYLFASRNAGNSKMIRLYKILDTMDRYDEGTITRSMGARQVANLKTNLYHLLLDSLRVQKSSLQIVPGLHQKIEHAGILAARGLYEQSFRLLTRVKETATTYHQLPFRFHAINLQKRILPFLQDPPGIALHQEAKQVAEELTLIEKLSTFSMLLGHHYQRYGEIVSDSHLEEIEEICREYYCVLPCGGSFYAEMSAAQGLGWYCLLQKDVAGYYRNVKKWNELFRLFPHMKEIEKDQCLKALYYLQDACYLSGLRQEQSMAAEELHRHIIKNDMTNSNEASLYLAIARLNQVFLEPPAELSPELTSIQAEINALDIQQPLHLLVELWHKMARLYCNSGDYEHAITYSNYMINSKKEIRFDLQAAARCTRLLAHYYLGNLSILGSLAHSTQRFIEGYRELNEQEMQAIELVSIR